MNQIQIDFIPLSNSGSICYLQGNLVEFESENSSLIDKNLREFEEKKIKKIIILGSENDDYEPVTSILNRNHFSIFIFKQSLDLQEQVEIFEKILDANSEENVAILFKEKTPSLIELVTKLVLYLNPDSDLEEIYAYFTNEKPDIVVVSELKEYLEFLENDPYLITKPDRSELNKDSIKLEKTQKIKPNPPSLKSTEEFTLNLNSLKTPIPSDNPLISETEDINFNLNSLVESDFEQEESAEEHFERLKHTSSLAVDDSLSLDVDLADEINYISSLEQLSTQTSAKMPAVPNETTNPKATIDYKAKEYLDFDAIIEEELDQGAVSKEFGFGNISLDSESFPEELDLSDISESIDSNLLNDDLFNTNSAINLDALNSKAKIDLSFPPPLQDIDDLELEQEEIIGQDNAVDPSQTFMIKRINEEIKREVLNEDSKGKIPVSELVKIDSKKVEAVQENKNQPDISKVTTPKFSPITLDD